ncbi:MAG: hypothetical protein ABR599_05750 [Gemmatimonadota bacterium]
MLRSKLVRLALGAAAVSLLFYIPYRYAVRAPHFEGFLGSAYAVLFPLSGLLALAALAAAWRPQLVERIRCSDASGPTRCALGVYGAGWVLTGLMCVSSFAALAAAAPLKGAFATLHMTTQHLFLGLAAVATALRPDVTAVVLGADRRLQETADAELVLPRTAS